MVPPYDGIDDKLVLGIQLGVCIVWMSTMVWLSGFLLRLLRMSAAGFVVKKTVVSGANLLS